MLYLGSLEEAVLFKSNILQLLHISFCEPLVFHHLRRNDFFLVARSCLRQLFAYRCHMPNRFPTTVSGSLSWLWFIGRLNSCLLLDNKRRSAFSLVPDISSVMELSFSATAVLMSLSFLKRYPSIRIPALPFLHKDVACPYFDLQMGWFWSNL